MANYKDGVGNYKGGGGVTITTQKVALSANITTTSTTFVDATGLTLTLANRTGGKFIAFATCNVSQSNVGVSTKMRLNWDGALSSEHWDTGKVAGTYDLSTIILYGDLDGTVVKIEWACSANTSTMHGSGGVISNLIIYEIS